MTGDDRWTCSSDDDFAVSMRLEELQEENRRQIRGEEPAAMVCSSPKEVANPPCVVVNVRQRVDRSFNEEDVAGPRHFDNLEIDPSAIVASCECVVNTPNEIGARFSAPVETVGPSVIAPAQGDETRAKTSTLSEKPKPSRPRGRPPKSIQGEPPKSRSRKPKKEEGADEPKKSRRPRKGNRVPVHVVLSMQYCIITNNSVYGFIDAYV